MKEKQRYKKSRAIHFAGTEGHVWLFFLSLSLKALYEIPIRNSFSRKNYCRTVSTAFSRSLLHIDINSFSF